ncbi:glutamate--cysteine ligase [Streptomyces sp. RerS4]|uniref:carboxylate-amine ligase n=1 Tax=Streptomyces sp. RerS4 TaxID=2942449 RepID=UPI00201C6614|nr:glutamate--cysteine ligase [Streptomyces sp. RerS4]UQX04661.1 glutamate--cysteine ligase [Streptomyces sp. RerS4]
MEEEYLVVDPVSRQLSTRADKVVAAAAAELGARVTTELTRYQVEVRTDPHTTLTALGEDLLHTRHAVARAAARLGLRVISSGTPVLGQHTPPPVTAGARYAQSLATFRALDHEQTVCACHIHVEIPDLATALAVSNHLRPWLPALIALGGNSPYWDGQDTGYDSWRTLAWGRWPVAGPPPYFESAAHYEDLVGRLITSHTLLDRGGVYWDIRPSHHVPTLEVRVADAAPTVDDTLLLVAAVKGLSAAGLSSVRDGRSAPRPQPEMLRAAYWRAARDGVRGQSIDLPSGRLQPATRYLEQLWNTALPPLSPTDRTHVRTARRQHAEQANGADRQRTAYRRRHSHHDVVEHLIDTYLGKPPVKTDPSRT